MRIMALISTLFFTQLSLAVESTPEVRAVYNEDMHMPHIGFSAGASTPEGSFDAGGTYSLEFGLQPIIPFSYVVKATYADYQDGATNFNHPLVSMPII